MKIITPSIAALLFTITCTAQAATIEISTRTITNTIDNNDFINTWSNQSSAINTSSISEFTTFYSGKYSMSHLSVDFNTSQAGTWGFEAGLDAHYGAALYLDNSLIGSRSDDLWWSYNWNNTDVMSLLNKPMVSGAHTLDIYWAESCCSGYNSARFTTDGSNWQALSTTNLESYATNVPEPMTIALLSIGLVGMTTRRRK